MASDAFEKGGGFCMARGYIIIDKGLRQSALACTEMKVRLVVVVDLSAGIGGLRTALERASGVQGARKARLHWR